MLRLTALAVLAASAEAFAPAGFSPKLRTAKPSATMAAQSPADLVKGAAAGALAAGIMLGVPALPADASVNSQMSMNSESFSVLTESKKEYAQKQRTVNPYASEEDKMKQLEKIARLEECEQKQSMKECELQETQREEMTLKAEAKKNNPLTFAVPIVVTTALSGVVLQFIKK